MNRLNGKVAIITGGAVGLGRAMVTRMAEQCALVAIADILETEGRGMMRELASRDFDVRYFYCDVRDFDVPYFHCDVSKEEDVPRTTAETVANFGRLYVLFNNAGFRRQQTHT